MDLFSWPFRLSVDGTVATVDADSDQATAEQIGVLILTRVGERELAPGFGIPDPTFAVLEPGAVTAGLALFGPPAHVDRVTLTGRPAPGVATYELAFTPLAAAADEPARYGLDAGGAVPDPAPLLDGPLP